MGFQIVFQSDCCVVANDVSNNECYKGVGIEQQRSRNGQISYVLFADKCSLRSMPRQSMLLYSFNINSLLWTQLWCLRVRLRYLIVMLTGRRLHDCLHHNKSEYRLSYVKLW